MINYASYTGEVNAFTARHACDWIDETLLPSDYATISGNTAYTFSNVTVFSLDEYDLNCAVNPFNNTAYRQAVSDLVQVNKASWLALNLGGGGAAAYSPISCDVLANSGIEWYDSATKNLWTLGYSGAFGLLMGQVGTVGGYNPVVDPLNSSCFTWAFKSSYLSTGPGGEPIMPNDQVYVYARSDDVAARLNLGTYLEDQCGNEFSDWGAANQATVNAALTAAGYSNLVGKQPRIEVYVYPITHSVGDAYVMVDYHFEAYTGGWSLGATPDNMEIYLSLYAGSKYDFTIPYLPNYGSVIDTTFDGYLDNMEASTYIGTPTQSPGGANGAGSGMYWCYQTQMQLMGNAWLIPMWYYTEMSPCLTTDYQNINEVGVGYANWFSFLEAYPTSGSPGASTDTLYFGMRGGLLNPNIISASWLWDWYPLGEIYDSLAAGNPYNVTQLIPYLADAFNETTWYNTETTATNTLLNIHLRSDVWWQDLPAGPGGTGSAQEPSVTNGRNGYTLDNDSLINGPVTNMPFTALDVAFSLAYYAIGNLFTDVHVGESASNIDHITISSIYAPYWASASSTSAGLPWANETYIEAADGVTPTTPYCPYINAYETLPQYENNIVQFNSTLDPYTVQVYLSSTMTWLAYYRVLGVPILPDYIFSHLALASWPTIDIQGHPWTTTDVTAMVMTPLSFSTSGADILYGTGPYIWVGQPTTGQYEFIPYNDGASYEGITEQHGYFWQPVRDADLLSVGHDPENVVTFKPGNSSTTSTPGFPYGQAGLALTEWVQNWLPTTVTVNFYFSVTYSEYNASGWSTPVSFNTATNTATLPASSLVAQHWWLPSLTSETVYEPQATPLSEGLMGKNAIPKIKNALWLILETDFVVTYTWTPDPAASPSAPGSSQQMLFASGSYLPNGVSTWDPNERPGPWWTLPACLYYPKYPYEIINFLWAEIPTTGYGLDGDMGGAKQLISPYPGADGAVNLKDLTVIATSYLKKGIVWTSGIFDPTDSLHRADINGDGSVNLKDLTFIALEYLKTYTLGTPLSLPTPPPA
jgi:hypothetical protein